MPSRGENSNDAFVMQVIGAQDQVFAYILSLTADRQHAHDVMQDVNCVLLEKSGDYEPGTNFLAWAKRVAHYELLALRRDKARERLVLDDEMVALLHEVHERDDWEAESRRDALRSCLDGLSEDARELIKERYYADQRVRDMASRRSVLPNVVTKRLARLRIALKDCIERRVAGEMA